MKEGTFLYPGKDFDTSIDGILKLKKNSKFYDCKKNVFFHFNGSFNC